MIKKAKTVLLDGFRNLTTGLGTSKDQNTASQVYWSITTRTQAEALYAGDDMAGKIANIIPFDGTREGITWKVKDAEPDAVSDFTDYMDYEFERLDAWFNLRWAWEQARIFGGAIVLMVIDDGQEYDQPVNMGRIRSVDALHVIDRWSFNISSSDLITDLSDPDYGKPEFYNYTGSSSVVTGQDSIRIHHSRVLRFDGNYLPDQLYKNNNYWHDSIYGKLYRPIRNYSTSHDNAASLSAQVNIPVIKLQGMNEALANDEDVLVQKKLEIVNNQRSTMRMIALDAEDEFINNTMQLTGAKDLIDLTSKRLIASSDIPHTRLLGESPNGGAIGETGKSELIDYYDMVASRQEMKLRPQLSYLAELIQLQVDNPSYQENWSFEFNPLYQQDQEAKIRTRQMQANIDDIYMRNGVYDSYEVAENRFGSGEYSYETNIENDEIDENENAFIPPEGMGVPTENSSANVNPESILNEVNPTELLNGAQVTAILSIVEQVSTGAINKATASALIKQSFGMSDEQVESILGPIDEQSRQPEPQPEQEPEA